MSYFVRSPTDPLDYAIVRRVGALLRLVRRDEPLELGDTLDANFVHRLTAGELAEELHAAGWAPRWSTAEGVAHSVAIAVT